MFSCGIQVQMLQTKKAVANYDATALGVAVSLVRKAFKGRCSEDCSGADLLQT
jgi:hypothetical protein